MAAHPSCRRKRPLLAERWTPWTSGHPHFWGGPCAPVSPAGRNGRFGCELRGIARIALLLSLLGCLSLAAPAATLAGGPGGQFSPSLDDRDGDGLLDALDCGPDDPTRPSRAGADLDCDGTADGGGAGIGVGLLPIDGGPDGPEGPSVASKPSTGTASTRAAARDAAGESVVPVRDLRLGPAIAVYAPAHPSDDEPTLVFVAKDNVGLTVTPWVADRARPTRTRSLPRGRAYVVRLRLHRARAVRFEIAVVGSDGVEYRATREVAAGDPRTA